MAITDVDVGNMALAVLGEAPIESFDEDHKFARLLNLHFDVTREAELGKYAWVFAIFEAELNGTEISEAVDGTLNYAYDLPPDCIRPLPPTYDGEPNGIPISWKQHAGVIYSDQSGPLKLRYVANLIDPNAWNAQFTEVVVGALAIKLALLTGKVSVLEVARSAYQSALDDALRTNALERYGQFYRQSWASARGDNRFWRA